MEFILNIVDVMDNLIRNGVARAKFGSLGYGHCSTDC